MKAWWLALVADSAGIPDEARLMYVIAQALYLLAWCIWFGCGGWARWPEHITAFAGGQSALTAAFGITVAVRGRQ